MPQWLDRLLGQFSSETPLNRPKRKPDDSSGFYDSGSSTYGFGGETTGSSEQVADPPGGAGSWLDSLFGGGESGGAGASGDIGADSGGDSGGGDSGGGDGGGGGGGD